VRAVVAHYDARAATYDESEMHRDLTDAVAAWVDLDGVEVVLDVATGTGLMLRSLARRRSGLRMIGVDLSPRMLDVARRELEHAALVLATASSLPRPDASVDLLTCITALHLFEDPQPVLAEWARVVAPDGNVVTATFRPDPERPADQFRHGFRRHHSAYASPELVGHAFERHGLVVTRSAELELGDDRLLVCELTRLGG
jgi:ubiquinone/menaquinone biosynthesis C-methylase UbiE